MEWQVLQLIVNILGWPANMWLICFVILKPVKANVFAVLLQSLRHMVH